MDILHALKKLRDDLKIWATNNFNALNEKIDEKTIPIDNKLSSSSTNPVQNKVVTNAINNIPRFSGDYNDLTNVPIIEDGSGNMVIADESGNIIFKADAAGIHTTAVSIDGEVAATEKYVDDAIIKIPTPDVSGQINAHNTNGESHADIRQAIEDAKEELSESIVAESNEWKVVDEAGNIIFSVDASGTHATEMTLNGEKVATEKYITEWTQDNNHLTVTKDEKESWNAKSDLTEANVKSIAASEINTLIGAVNSSDTIENITTLVNYVNEHGADTAALVAEVYGASEPANESRIDALEKALEDKSDFSGSYKDLTDKPTLATLGGDDATHRLVTDIEKTVWNNKSDFSGDYNDLENAPNITEDESNNLVIADPNGNIIFRSDSDGFETTKLTAEELIVGGVNVGEAIEELGCNCDLSAYQTKADESLATTAKSIVGAINELSNGKLPYITVSTDYNEKIETIRSAIETATGSSETLCFVNLTGFYTGNLIIQFAYRGHYFVTCLHLNSMKRIEATIEDLLTTSIGDFLAVAPSLSVVYQSKEDESLETTDQTVVGAINELYDVLYSYSPSKGLEYRISDDEQYAICCGLGTCTDTDAIIASEYEGKPVTTISEWAFREAFDLTSIYIPSSIHTVEEHGIYDCFNLVAIYCEAKTAPEGLESNINWQPAPEIVLGYKIVPTLDTESKSIIGAINEVNDKAIDKIATIDTYAGDMEEVFDEGDGISWANYFEMRNGSEVVAKGSIAQKIPISAGDGISFEKDGDTNAIKINSIYGADDSVIGTWVFKDYISMNGSTFFDVTFVCDGVEYVAIADKGDGIYFYNSDGDAWSVYYYDAVWEDAVYKTIKILEEPSEEASAWIKASARKKPPIGVERITRINTWWSGRDGVENNGDGIAWSDGFAFTDDMGNEITTGSITQSIPLVAGNNVTFSYDENNNAIAINAAGGGSGDSIVGLQTPITYSELKALRDNSELVPGMFYRIIDYQCTTTQEDTRAMDHRFDIIVQALDVHKLSENASAIWHEGDTYFSEHNLVAWELKYAIDNDTSRFIWADGENGKGVIYYMKDDLDNECPYDFKNIQFKRYKVTECEVASLVGEYVGVEGYDEMEPPSEIQYDSNDFIWCYTFTLLLDNEIIDVSTSKEYQLAEKNEIKKYSLYRGYGDNLLNNNIFILPRWLEDEYFSIRGNKVEGAYNTLDASYTIEDNLIKGYCNVFVSYDVYDNTVHGSENIFGGYVNRSTIRGYRNFFFGNVKSVTTGYGCDNNRFGTIDFSSLGDNCYQIMFCSSDLTPASYITNLHIADNCGYLKLINEELGNRNSYVRGVTIPPDIKGTASAYKEFQVSRNAAPVVFEAANTTHIILD